MINSCSDWLNREIEFRKTGCFYGSENTVFRGIIVAVEEPYGNFKKKYESIKAIVKVTHKADIKVETTSWWNRSSESMKHKRRVSGKYPWQEVKEDIYYTVIYRGFKWKIDYFNPEELNSSVYSLVRGTYPFNRLYEFATISRTLQHLTRPLK